MMLVPLYRIQKFAGFLAAHLAGNALIVGAAV